MGHTINVEMCDHLVNETDSVGLAIYREHKIKIQTSTGAYPRTPQMIEHTYLHEVLHHILDMLGYHELQSDEQFVDSVSGLIHQALTTAE